METVIFSEKAIIPFTDAIKVWMHGEKYLAIIKKKKKKKNSLSLQEKKNHKVMSHLYK